MCNREFIRYVIFVVLLLFLMSLCSCTVYESFMDDQVSDNLLEDALTAIEAGDQDAFVALYGMQLSDIQDADESVAQVFKIYQGQMSGYEKIGRYLRWQSESGQRLDYVECTYRVTPDADEYFITIARSTDDVAVQLLDFYLARYEDFLANQPIGIIGEFSNWNAHQWDC